MLREPTMQKLYVMKFSGMAAALKEQRQQAALFSLSFEDRLAFLVERELEERKVKKTKATTPSRQDQTDGSMSGKYRLSDPSRP